MVIELLLKCRINANFVRNHRLIQLSASHHNFPVHRKSNETKYHWTSWFFFLSISTFQKTTHFFLFTNKQLSITPPISFNPVFLCFPLPIPIRFIFFFYFVTTLSRVLTRNSVYMSTLYSHLIDTVCVSTLFLCFYSKFHFSIFILGLKLAIRYHWYWVTS